MENACAWLRILHWPNEMELKLIQMQACVSACYKLPVRTAILNFHQISFSLALGPLRLFAPPLAKPLPQQQFCNFCQWSSNLIISDEFRFGFTRFSFLRHLKRHLHNLPSHLSTVQIHLARHHGLNVRHVFAVPVIEYDRRLALRC